MAAPIHARAEFHRERRRVDHRQGPHERAVVQQPSEPSDQAHDQEKWAVIQRRRGRFGQREYVIIPDDHMRDGIRRPRTPREPPPSFSPRSVDQLLKHKYGTGQRSGKRGREPGGRTGGDQ